MKTTDPQDELFDLVDENDKVIGTVKRRETNRNPKRIHRAVCILVFNKKGQLFLQKRSKTKDTYPGYWTISASGHVRSGQTYRQAAIKELKEELGIKEGFSLKRLGKSLMDYPNETEYETFFQMTYIGPIILHPEEIAQGKFITLNRKFFQTTLKKMKITPELEYIATNVLQKT